MIFRPNKMFEKKILENGLRIIAVPQADTQAVTILIMVKAGSSNEKREISGISHLLEHVLFKGTKKRPSWEQVDEDMDRMGAERNAFTGYECTGYWIKAESSNFENALEVISDIFLNAILKEKDIEKEKGVIVEEINMYEDSPSLHITRVWRELLYGDQPSGWDIAGTKESVKGISRGKLLDYFKKQYTAKNSLVCVAGNIKSEEVFLKTEKYFSAIGEGELFLKKKTVENQKKSKVLLEYRKTGQTNLCLGVRGYNIFHPRRYALRVLEIILGGMPSSRLFAKVRQELGTVYAIHTFSDMETDCGYLSTYTGVANKKAEEAIKIILKEYKRISEEKVSSAELERAQNYIKGKLALNLETSDERASFCAEQELLEGEILTSGEIFAKIKSVSAEDILDVAKDIFKPENLNLALIGPFRNKKKFQQLLKF